MSIYPCPKGHSSTEPDYCSECGTKIQGTPILTVETRNFASLHITCPACTAPHNPSSGDFCEICGYNFVTKMHGEVPHLEPGNGGVGEQGSRGVGEKNTNSPPRLCPYIEIIATVDPSRRSPESPEAPVQPPITFKLDKESNLIGRNSTLRGVYPEIALDFDSAVSQRHALLNRQPDGTFILRDIGSTNGTKLNGVELTPMVDVPIKDGDEFTLGHWTRLKVKLISN